MGVSSSILLPNAINLELDEFPQTVKAISNLYTYLKPVSYTPEQQSGMTFPGDQYGMMQKIGGFTIWSAVFPTGYSVSIGKGTWWPPIQTTYGEDEGFVVAQYRYKTNLVSGSYPFVEYSVKTRGASILMPDPSALANRDAGDPIYIMGITVSRGR